LILLKKNERRKSSLKTRGYVSLFKPLLWLIPNIGIIGWGDIILPPFKIMEPSRLILAFAIGVWIEIQVGSAANNAALRLT